MFPRLHLPGHHVAARHALKQARQTRGVRHHSCDRQPPRIDHSHKATPRSSRLQSPRPAPRNSRARVWVGDSPVHGFRSLNKARFTRTLARKRDYLFFGSIQSKSWQNPVEHCSYLFAGTAAEFRQCMFPRKQGSVQTLQTSRGGLPLRVVYTLHRDELIGRLTHQPPAATGADVL